MARTTEFHAAGRPLDALIAEKVTDLNPHWLGEADEEVLSVGESGREIPRYSTDIVAAWQVVEKLRQNGLHLQIDSDTSHWTVPPLSFTGWIASFVRDGKHFIGIADTDYGDTVAVAICRAALHAVESVQVTG